MANHIGIELSPSACRIVELDGRRSSLERPVTAYAAIPKTSPATLARLASLRGRHAAVVVWGWTSDHRQLAVRPGPYERMHAEARAAVRKAGHSNWRTLSDIAPLSGPDERSGRRTIVLVSAAAAEVATTVRPLVNAGIEIDRVLTPAAALLSLARTRRALAGAGAVEAYVALEEGVTCLALVRDLQLVAASDLAWGFVDDRAARGTIRAREDIASRLAGNLAAMLAECRLDPRALQQVCVCGALPELRSAAMALMERIDAEVEPLDSLFGIDPDRLPRSPDDFRDRVAELRLAWAAARDENSPIDLCRAGRRRARRASWSRSAVAAGIATGLVVGSQVAPSIAGVISPELELASTKIGRPIKTVTPSTVVGPRFSSGGIELAATVSSELKPARTSTGHLPEPTLGPTGTGHTPELKLGRASSKPKPASTGNGLVDSTAENPFTATLNGILFAPDRKLAIIDGRIIQVGDEVHATDVIEITPTAVVFRDTRGRLRKLTSSGWGR